MRKNQAPLTRAEKTAFVNTVLALRQAPSMLHPENRAWSRYDDFVEVHLNANPAKTASAIAMIKPTEMLIGKTYRTWERSDLNGGNRRSRKWTRVVACI